MNQSSSLPKGGPKISTFSPNALIRKISRVKGLPASLKFCIANTDGDLLQDPINMPASCDEKENQMRQVCGKLVAEIIKKSGAKKQIISYAISFEFSFGSEKNLAWAVRHCGHGNPFDPAIRIARAFLSFEALESGLRPFLRMQ
jgi:hypothetical protein